MRRLTFWLGVAAVIAIGSWGVYVRSFEPKLVVKSRHIDMCLVRPGEFAESEIEIENQGSGKLVISGIRTSCSCSIGRIEKRVLNPSEKTKLIVRVKGSPNPSSSARISLESNDSTTPVTELGVWFRSRSGIWAEPDMISFGHLNPDNFDSSKPLLLREFSIKGDRQNGPLKFDQLVIENDNCFREAFVYKKLEETHGDIRMQVMPHANGPYGMINGKLNISDESGNRTTIKFEAYAPHPQVTLLKPVFMQMSNGTCEGSGSIVLQDGFKGSVISSRMVGEQLIRVDSILSGSVVSLNCQTGDKPKDRRFTLEICLRQDFTDQVFRIWLPVVME